MTVALSEAFPDISYYQKPLDDTFDKRSVTIRLGDGNDFLDPYFAHNIAWCNTAYADGRLDLFGIYHVYRPVGAASLFGFITAHLPQCPAGAYPVTDLESWGGQIVGDHSTDLNTFYGMLAAWSGSLNRFLEYGNLGDLNNLHPTADTRIRFTEAGYGNTTVHHPRAIAKQWTNGQPQYDIPGLSASTPPVGRCDSNVFIGMTLAEAAVALDITPPTPEDDDMQTLFIVGIDGHANPNDPGAAYYLANAAEHRYFWLQTEAQVEFWENVLGIKRIDSQGALILAGFEFGNEPAAVGGSTTVNNNGTDPTKIVGTLTFTEKS